MQEVSRAIRGANPARPEFIGLIKSHTNEISNVPELCKTIGMPIIVFKNGNCNLYSMKVAFMEALRLRYKQSRHLALLSGASSKAFRGIKRCPQCAPRNRNKGIIAFYILFLHFVNACCILRQGEKYVERN